MNLWQMSKAVLTHPIDFYYDLQIDKRAKVSHAFIIIAVTILVKFYSLALVSYIFETKEPMDISFIIEAAIVFIPWISWAVSNWGVSTIMDGEGKFIEVLVGSAYALVPYTFFSLPIALLSNVLTDKDRFLYTTLLVFVYAWAILLILMQVKILHDFEFSKMLFITILTLIGMLIIWFVILLIYGLINQGIMFVVDLWKEINFRL